MKLGLVCGPDSIRIAQKLKVDGVSFNATDLVAEGGREKLAALRALQLEPCQIAAYSFNPLLPDPAERLVQEHILAAAIPHVPSTGCRDLVINGGNRHPSGYAGSHRDNFTEGVLDEIARKLEPWVARCEAAGVNLTIEPHVQCAINTPERFLQLKSRLCSRRLMITLDLCNFLTFAELWDPTARLLRICEQLQGHYESVHLKNLGAQPGTHIHVNEVPFLEGQVDWVPVLKAIRQGNPSAYLILEKVKTEAEAEIGIAAIRRMIA
jgi:sugar phosphate isomerase/epimerase